MIDCGFTGTRNGMTEKQKVAVVYILSQLQHKVDKYRHGDCVGADQDFHEILTKSGFNDQIELHPCDIDSQRAWCKAPVIHEPKPPLERNKDIVRQSSILLVCPSGEKEVLRSGTWATYREGLRRNKNVIIVYPLGKYKKILPPNTKPF